MKEYFKLIWRHINVTYKIALVLFTALGIIELCAGFYHEFFNTLTLLIWVIMGAFYQSFADILHEDNEQKDEEIKNLRNLVQTIFKDVKK